MFSRLGAGVVILRHALFMARWLGVDVGGKRKGFDVALVDDQRLLDLQDHVDHEEVVELIEAHQPAVVAIDSPRCCAPDGEATRAGERELAKAICGIRWTPDERRVHDGNSYYAWIIEGLALYKALATRKVEVIEVFPTASWTRWHGRRGGRRRAAWSREGLARIGLEGVPTRTNQDQRDAIAAAVTGRQHTQGLTETMGEIVVPLGSWQAPQDRLGYSPLCLPALADPVGVKGAEDRVL
jgi:predicted nuclease with RNAse H fold